MAPKVQRPQHDPQLEHLLPKVRLNDTFRERLEQSRKTSNQLEAEAEQDDTKANIEKLIANRLQLYEELDKQSNLSLEILRMGFEEGKTDEDTYRAKREELIVNRKDINTEELYLHSQRRNIAEEVVEKGGPRSSSRDLARIVQEAITRSLDMANAVKQHGRDLKNIMHSSGQKMTWLKILTTDYKGCTKPDEEAGQILDPNMKDLFWCPIVKKWRSKDDVVGAHIVPRSHHDLHLEMLFDCIDPQGFLMAAKNGIIMTKQLEKFFDQGFFTIIPRRSYEEDERWEYKLKVINEGLLKKKGGKKTMWGRIGEQAFYFDELDGTKLQFPEECALRPGRRNLYHHMMTAVIYSRENNWHGWRNVMSELVQSGMWASPGKYLDKGMVSKLWQYIKLTGPVPEAVIRHTFSVANEVERVRMLSWRRAMEDALEESLKRRVEDEEED